MLNYCKKVFGENLMKSKNDFQENENDKSDAYVNG